ncbi:MAG: hypothetical protein CR965_01065, partial [Paludibacter sp.]
MKKILLVGFLFLTLTSNFAQIEMGGWRTHLSYNKINQICDSENKVFAVSEGSLFSVDKRDENMEFYSKISGLNGTVISKIEYDYKNKILVVVYRDGNIDFVSSGGIQNLPDFYNKQIAVKKTTNDILIHNGTAYLSTAFGIITLNIKKKEIQDTYYIGENASNIEVLNTTILKNKIYATSKNDLYFADVNNPQIINYQNWTKIDNLPSSGDIKSFQAFENKGILLRENKLFVYDNGIWTPLDASLNVENIRVSHSYLFIFTNNKTFYYKDNLTNKIEIKNLSSLIDGIVENKTQDLWFCGDSRGLARYKNEQADFYKPNGPAVNIPYQMKFAGEKLFVVQGGRWASQFFREGIVMMFENNQWTNISNQEIVSETGKRAGDFMNIAIDPTDNKHFWVSSYANGVFEFKNNQFDKWYNFTNSTIETIFPNKPSAYEYMRVDGGTYDSDGNVWFSNTSASKSIKYYNTDGTWGELTHNKISKIKTLSKILISKKNPNQKWLLSLRHKPGVIIINDNGTHLNADDDQVVFKTSLKYKVNDEIRTFSP